MSVSLENLGIDRLSMPERLDLIAAIWDSIPNSPEALPLPEWHREELEQRLKTAESAPNEGAPWEEVRAQLRRQA